MSASAPARVDLHQRAGAGSASRRAAAHPHDPGRDQGDGNAGHYTLVGDTTGAQSVTFSYQIPNNRTVLTAASLLPADTYTLTVSDNLTAVNSGQKLDGEMADPAAPASLPSGDGVAGGIAQVRFTVNCGGGDADCDGDVDLFDYAKFQTCYTGSGGVADASCRMMAIDLDQDVDLDDYELFAGLLGI